MRWDEVPTPLVLAFLAALLAAVSFLLGLLFAYLKNQKASTDTDSDMDVIVDEYE